MFLSVIIGRILDIYPSFIRTTTTAMYGLGEGERERVCVYERGSKRDKESVRETKLDDLMIQKIPSVHEQG